MAQIVRAQQETINMPSKTSLAEATAFNRYDLKSAVEQSTIEYLGAPPVTGLIVSNIATSDMWASGTVGIYAPSTEGAGPNGLLFLAQQKEQGWQVAIEHTPTFQVWISQAPEELINADAKAILTSSAPEGDGSTQLSLPWTMGETWTFTGGPHHNCGRDWILCDTDDRPWSALDFAGGTGQVSAARDGFAYLDCPNFVRINHNDGWQTGYYHLTNIAVSNGQWVSRGQLLGNISTATGCGGSATGPHQHFSLQRDGVLQEINGHDIGGWTMQEGSAQYEGCMMKDGNLKCVSSGQIYNDGTIGSSDPPTPPPTTDSATFVSDVTLPDGTVVSPGEALVKTWRMRNNGTSTWGSDYQLAFTGGEQMGAPSAVNVPATAPDQEVDISVNIIAPSTGGSYQGNWRMRNSSGTYFGDQIWVRITVPDDSIPPPVGDFSLTCMNCPAVVPPGQTFRPTIRATIASGQLLETRGDMLRNTDGNLFGAHPHIAVEGTVNPGQYYDFTFYAANPITAPDSDGIYQTKWRLWQNGQYVGPELKIDFQVQPGGGGTNYPPNPPTLTGPGDWAIFQGTPVVLTAQHNGDPDGDAITGYYFDLLGPNPTNSGWIGSNTWNPQGLPFSNYEWRVKVSDSRGAESGWSSQTWHFNVLNNEPEIYEFYTVTCRDAWGGSEKICFCAKTNAGTLQLQVNTATDGSDQGEWRIINELGVPEYRCQEDSDRPPNTHNLEWETGTHRARLYARREGGWANAAYRDITFSLPAERRPNNPPLRQPPNQIYINAFDVHFDWDESLRTTGYQLEVSDNPDYSILLVDEHFSAGTTEYDYTFSTDYETIYWRVTASGPYGANESTNRFYIDIEPPVSVIGALPPVTTETKFSVNWGGSDLRSGLRWYDVQVRDGERGEWRDWLVNTTKTAELFSGQTGHTYYFRVRAMDEIGNWEAWPSGDGDTYTLVDPTAAPPTSWWDNDYNYKRNMIILNNDGQTLPVHFPIHLHFDASTDPTAAEIHNASLSSTQGDDVRVVYNNQTELDRFIQRFTSSQIDIWFPLQTPLSGGQTDNSSYQIFYGNSNATSPPSDVDNIFLPTPDANTIGLWHFQEGSGSHVFDTSGQNHHGTFHSADWVDGFLGTAGKFNGSNSHVDVGNSNDFNLASGPMTLEAWINLPNGTGGTYPYVISKWGPGDGSYNLLIMGGGNPQWNIRSGGQATAGTRLESGKWYHVAATYNGIDTMRIFINGNQAASNTNANDGLSTTRRLFIGWADGESGGQFPGYIQHVRVSNVERTDFPYAKIDVLPSVEAGAVVAPPGTGTPDLSILSMTTYSNPDGGVLVQAIVQNQGEANTLNGFYTDLYVDHLPTGGGDYTGSVRFWVNDPINAGSAITLTTVINDLVGLSGMVSNPVAPASESKSTLFAQTDSAGVIGEQDEVNNIYEDGIEVCVAYPDAYESDDTAGTATLIGEKQIQIHNFSKPSDQDWVKFDAQDGEPYTLRTYDLDTSADTYLYLYDTDGSTLLVSNDDYGGSLASQIEWTAPITGTYYMLIQHWNPNVGGCGTKYSIVIGDLSVFLPFMMM